MNTNNRIGRKALRTLVLRSAIHADHLHTSHMTEYRRTLIGMFALLVLLICTGMIYREHELEQIVMVAELSQLPLARAGAQESATKDAELRSLRQVAEATKSAKPNVIYIDRGTTKGKALDAVVQKWGAEHLEAFTNLISHESGFNALAMNKTSGACGIFQAVPCSKMKCELPDVECQISWGLGYIQNRYGSPSQAWAFWQSRVKIAGKDVGNWY